MLALAFKQGESVAVTFPGGGTCQIMVYRFFKKGPDGEWQVSLSFDAPPEIKILRKNAGVKVRKP